MKDVLRGIKPLRVFTQFQEKDIYKTEDSTQFRNPEIQ